MVDLNGNGNGKQALKFVLAIAAAILFGLLAWDFKAVQDLQVRIGENDQRIIGIHADIEAINTILATFVEDEKKADSEVYDILTDLRIQRGAPKNGKPK